MGRRGRGRREAPGPSGFLVVDKPPEVTSHDVVDAARRWLGTRRVGHLGTLDPRATGVLPLAIRDATKLASFVPADIKVYRGAIELGVATDTFDTEGTVVRRHEGALPSEADVRAAMTDFVGEILQVPPMYSSVKHGGEPLHRIARRGEEVERAPRKVNVQRFELLEWEPPRAVIEVVCGTGTYVRSLADELGERLGCGAHLAELRRFQSGPFTLEQAATVEQLDKAAEAGEIDAHLVDPAKGLGLPTVSLSPAEAARVGHGGDVAPAGGGPRQPGSRVAALAPSGALLAVMEVRPDRRLHPLRVLPVVPQG